MSLTDAPIGVFDSGVGGLSVLCEIRAMLPCEELIYVADSGAAPYGERSTQFILDRANAIVGFFAEKGVKAIVVACNTATAVAIKSLRATYAMPIIAIEPAVKPAAAQTRTGVIGILATSQTLTSEKFTDLVNNFGQGVRVLTRVCSAWVAQVERGDLQSERTRELVAAEVHPLIAQGADTLVLGCTHFPFLSPVIRNLVGTEVAIIDPAGAVAGELQRRLALLHMLRQSSEVQGELFWSSGDVNEVSAVITRLWGAPVTARPLPSRFSID
ncbi:MAG: glutamate racemase [Burkholderiales bacterium]